MRAIVCRTYGSPDVLHLEETATPAATDDQVLIRVRAASVNPYDWHSMRGSPYIMRMASGPTRPKDIRVGVDVAGVVETVGSKITRFKPGDPVFGGCRGAFAEYACAADRSIAPKPTNVTFEQAATVAVAGHTALHGGVGTFAVQIAKSFGARVTGVCSTSSLDLVRSLGADRVIDYTRQDFTTGSDRYESSWTATPAVRCSPAPASSLRPDATLRRRTRGGLIGPLRGALKVFVLAPFVRLTLTMVMAKPNREDLGFIADLMKTEAVTPVIDRATGSMKCRRRFAISNRVTRGGKSSSPSGNGWPWELGVGPWEL